MPKMKTDRGAAKRVKVTGTGRLRRLQQNRSHLLEHKSSARKRRLSPRGGLLPGGRAAGQADARPLGTPTPTAPAGSERRSTTTEDTKEDPPWPE